MQTLQKQHFTLCVFNKINNNNGFGVKRYFKLSTKKQKKQNNLFIYTYIYNQ